MKHKLAELTVVPAALLFADYCKTLGLQVMVVTEPGQRASLYCNEADVLALEQELQQFLQHPAHPRYQAAAWQQSKPVSLASGKALLPSLSWQQAQRWPLTLLLTILVLLVYGWQQLDWQGANAALQLNNPEQYWRWLTPILLHYSLTHLVFNLMWWLILARQLEQQQGAWFLLSMTLSSALLSNGCQYLFAGGNFGGLSGVVYALFGYCWLQAKLQPAKQYGVSDGLALFMLGWLVLGFADLLWFSMANWAHLAGLAAGLLWAAVQGKGRR